MIYLTKIPWIIQQIYPTYTWHYKKRDRLPSIYLTFDDGPTPHITPWVLDELKKYNAKATFFLIGKNVEKYPEIVHRTIDEGHSIGNHTQTHKNGREIDSMIYLKDFLKAQQVITEYTGYNTRLFRPPYGRITRAQAKRIQRTHELVMMDVISGDFDAKLSGEQCWKNVVKHTRDGSIVLLHDSKKAEERLRFVLPRLLDHFSHEGYQFMPIAEARAKDVETRLIS